MTRSHAEVAAHVELSADTARAVATVQAWQQAFNERDVDGLLALSTPEVEVATPRPGHGHGAIQQLVDQQTYGVGLHVDARRYLARSSTVIADALLELRWVDSGEVAERRSGAGLFEVRDGRVHRFCAQPDLRSAFRAAGWSDAERSA